MFAPESQICFFEQRFTNKDCCVVACQPAISRINIFVVSGLNVLTDIYLLTIPIPMLWKANIRPMKKVALIVTFSGGIFVISAGTLRSVLIITVSVFFYV